MKTIHKYPLRDIHHQSLQIPAGAKILTVQAQRNEIQLWAEVDPDAPVVTRHIDILTTGEGIDDELQAKRTHLGTVQLDGGDMVLHVFEFVP